MVLKKRTIVNCQVVDIVSSKLLKIADDTKVVDLKIESAKVDKFQKYLLQGSFVQLMQPLVNEDKNALILNDKSIVCHGNEITGINPFSDLTVFEEVEKLTQVHVKVILKVSKIVEYFDYTFSNRFPVLSIINCC